MKDATSGLECAIPEVGVKCPTCGSEYILQQGFIKRGVILCSDAGGKCHEPLPIFQINKILEGEK